MQFFRLLNSRLMFYGVNCVGFFFTSISQPHKNNTANITLAQFCTIYNTNGCLFRLSTWRCPSHCLKRDQPLLLFRYIPWLSLNLALKYVSAANRTNPTKFEATNICIGILEHSPGRITTALYDFATSSGFFGVRSRPRHHAAHHCKNRHKIRSFSLPLHRSGCRTGRLANARFRAWCCRKVNLF